MIEDSIDILMLTEKEAIDLLAYKTSDDRVKLSPIERMMIADLIQSLSREVKIARAAMKAVEQCEDCSSDVCTNGADIVDDDCENDCVWYDFCRLLSIK